MNVNVVGFQPPVIQYSPGVLPYAYDSPSPQHYRLPLDSARSDIQIALSGNVVWIDKASDKDAVATFKLNSTQSSGIDFTEGKAIIGVAFKEIYVSNTAQAGKYLDVFALAVPGLSGVQVVNPGATFANVDLTKPTTGASIADITITNGAAGAVILAANSDRHRCIVTALTTNDQELRIGPGDSAITDTRGIPLQPGESIEIEGTMAIYACTTLGSDQKVAVSYIAK